MKTDIFHIDITHGFYSNSPVFPLIAHSVSNHNLVAFVTSMLIFNC